MRTCLTAIIFVVLLASCSRTTPTPTPSPTPAPTAAEVLDLARDAIGDIQSYRFLADMYVYVETDEGPHEARMSGEWAGPDRSHMKIEHLGERAGEVSETIAVGGRVFARDSDSHNGEWREQSPDSAAAYGVSVLGPTGMLKVPDVEDLALLGDETVDGLPAFRLQGKRTTEVSMPPTPNPGETFTSHRTTSITYDLFVDKTDYLLLRMAEDVDVLVSTSSPADADHEYQLNEHVTWGYYDFDQPLTIEPPDVS